MITAAHLSGILDISLGNESCGNGPGAPGARGGWHFGAQVGPSALPTCEFKNLKKVPVESRSTLKHSI